MCVAGNQHHRLTGCDGAKPRGGLRSWVSASVGADESTTSRGQQTYSDVGTAIANGYSSRGRNITGKRVCDSRGFGLDEFRLGRNVMNPMTGSGMQQARKRTEWSNRRDGEKP
jgi:hypothetical protein